MRAHLRVLVATGAALTIAPIIAEGCATCISTPFGDRSYNWPYLVLIMVPLVLMTCIGGVLMRVTGMRFSDLRPWLTRIVRGEDSEAPQEGFGVLQSGAPSTEGFTEETT